MFDLSKRASVLLAGLGLVLLIACDPADVPAIRIRINADLSGEVLGSSMTVATERKGELGGRGVDWEEAATVVVRKGSFKTLDGDGLDLSGIRLRRGADDVPGLHRLVVTVPLGADAAWTRDFIPVDESERLRRALDADRDARNLGKKLLIEISLPGPAKDSSLVRERAGFQADRSGSKATLEIDLARARTQSGEVHWLLSWIDPR